MNAVSPSEHQHAAAQWRRRSVWVLGAIALITVFSGWRASQIGFNYDFEAFFPQGQPETSFYLQFREAFSTDNDFILVGIQHEEGVFDLEFLSAVRALSDSLETVQGVTQVIDPTELSLPVQRPCFGDGISTAHFAVGCPRTLRY